MANRKNTVTCTFCRTYPATGFYANKYSVYIEKSIKCKLCWEDRNKTITGSRYFDTKEEAELWLIENLI